MSDALVGLQNLLTDPNRIVVLDGGFATELEKDPRVDLNSSSLWSASLLLDKNEPLQQVVVNAHQTYFLAGADVATTASYQASVDGFKREGVTAVSDVERLYAKSIDLAVQARNAAWNEIDQTKRIKPLVGASIGCYGAALADGSEYRGDYGKTKKELVDWHRDRFAFFANYAPADFLICETIPCLVEVEAFVDLLNEFPTAHAIVAVACHNDTELNSGEQITRIPEILAKLKNPSQLLAIGINCTPPQHVESLLRLLDCPWPKAVYPNSGEGWDGVNKVWLPGTSTGGPSSWDEFVPKWFDAGARFFGGCCRTSPDDIHAIREFFDRRQQ
ncbi:Catalyzes methyl transfer from S-methylmethionine (SMM) to adenosyl-L-homocysteine (AdoMet) [Phytophthora boehmeriae]|uniref:Catalyzes methyl transfer from S-methylmethionine (SMM) to adenosyl-L-homocysteine (AdoMet) n=1 Tax=Phytophthora boehmeriae TaxID=109152 RepID=A0A8T1WVJ2_9STRA|nr:Catalyzes methyl transfer from S-methylmethionine (SMM) to adenosyl-L-homocysteine (AdoMet) [Phytophthora boehmeriae]